MIWPAGMGLNFKGTYDLARQPMLVFDYDRPQRASAR